MHHSAVFLHMLLVSFSLVSIMNRAGGRSVDRDCRWSRDLLDAFGELGRYPGCAPVEDADANADADAETRLVTCNPPRNTRDDKLQKLKRTRKNYSTMEETCECMTDFNKWNIRNLSLGHYPSAVTEINCTENSCRSCHMPYRCRAHRYGIYVLKEKTDNDNEPDDFNMPDNLRGRWKFVKVPVSIGCKCTKERD